MLEVLRVIIEALISALAPEILDRMDRPDTAASAEMTGELRQTRDALRKEIRDFEGI